MLTCILILAASVALIHAPTAAEQTWDPLDVKDHHQYQPFGKYGPTINVGVANPTKVRNRMSSGQANGRVAQRTATGRATKLEDLNISVKMPSGNWNRLDPQATGSRANYLISRKKPTIFISLAGEQVGTAAADTNSTLLADSQAKMLNLSGAEIEPGERPLTAGGIPGVAYEATVTGDQSATYYAIWVAAHHGYIYKLAVYGEQKHQGAIDAALQTFLSGIQPLQAPRVANSTTKKKTATR